MRLAAAAIGLLLSTTGAAVAQEALSNVRVGQFVYLSGKVIQSIQSGNSYVLRVNITRNDYGNWRDTVLVKYRAVSPQQTSIPEDTIVSFQGWNRGLGSYETVLGKTLELPIVEACLLYDRNGALRFAPPPGCPQ
ncbi:hypothetical protein H8A97_12880 [Bradyrhizobium sp. Arg62]|uniref:hypothetical protein n=1 Tax=Bradyrhizobium brasilense TaxID=1419277 RepID=UPI001E4B72F3|nr:hypothetical protein [Bradyrhizobium brasilense]MCC8945967.1 hypothetical protein [Bradyrhizobium brasilense]